MSFRSFMQHVGHDIKVGLEFLFPYLQTTGQIAIDTFAPGLGPLFRQTVAAVVTAEQNANAIAESKVTGQQKAASVIGLMGPLIAAGLHDVGKDSSDAAVQRYIDAVVTVLNTAPAPPSAA